MDDKEIDNYGQFRKDVLRPLRKKQGWAAVCDRLRALLEEETCSEIRREIVADLAIYSFYGEGRDESLKWKMKAIEEWPDDPLVRGSLATWYATHQREGQQGKRDLETALEENAAALEPARRQDGLWLRYLLFDRCRIAAQANRYEEIEKAMEEAMATLPVEFLKPDIPYIEADWLGDLPQSAIDPDLVERYMQAAKKTNRSYIEGIPDFFRDRA